MYQIDQCATPRALLHKPALHNSRRILFGTQRFELSYDLFEPDLSSFLGDLILIRVMFLSAINLVPLLDTLDLSSKVSNSLGWWA
jgi:hypothetical protein